MTARTCGTCSACCVVLGIAELGKPMHQRCPHQAATAGCGIYETRPKECRAFECGWLTGLLRESDRPDRLGVILAGADKQTNLLARDLGMAPVLALEWRPGALDEEPVRDALRRLAREHVLVLLRGVEELGILAPKDAVRRINQWTARKRAGEAR